MRLWFDWAVAYRFVGKSDLLEWRIIFSPAYNYFHHDSESKGG